jgi:hypothetical protein
MSGAKLLYAIGNRRHRFGLAAHAESDVKLTFHRSVEGRDRNVKSALRLYPVTRGAGAVDSSGCLGPGFVFAGRGFGILSVESGGARAVRGRGSRITICGLQLMRRRKVDAGH